MGTWNYWTNKKHKYNNATIEKLINHCKHSNQTTNTSWSNSCYLFVIARDAFSILIGINIFSFVVQYVQESIQYFMFIFQLFQESILVSTFPRIRSYYFEYTIILGVYIGGWGVRAHAAPTGKSISVSFSCRACERSCARWFCCSWEPPNFFLRLLLLLLLAGGRPAASRR